MGRDGAGRPRCAVSCTAIVASVARPTAPPIWRVELTRPEARPASRGRHPRRGGVGARREAQPQPERRDHDRARGCRSRTLPSADTRDIHSSPAAITQRRDHQHPPARAEARHQARRRLGPRDDRQRRRQERQARPQRALAQHALQVERHEVPHREHRPADAEHRQVGPGQRRRAQQPERHERRCGHPRLDDQERRHQDRGDDEGGRRLRRAPADDVRPHQAVDERGEAPRHEQRAGDVEAAGAARRGAPPGRRGPRRSPRRRPGR